MLPAVKYCTFDNISEAASYTVKAQCQQHQLRIKALVLGGISGYFAVSTITDFVIPMITAQTNFFERRASVEWTRTYTNRNDTEANAARRSGIALALRKQSKCRVIIKQDSRARVRRLLQTSSLNVI